jgi:hypothetical protein
MHLSLADFFEICTIRRVVVAISAKSNLLFVRQHGAWREFRKSAEKRFVDSSLVRQQAYMALNTNNVSIPPANGT